MGKKWVIVGAAALAVGLSGCAGGTSGTDPSASDSVVAPAPVSPKPSVSVTTNEQLPGGITPNSPVASVSISDDSWLPQITGSAPMDADAQQWSGDGISFYTPGTCTSAGDRQWTCAFDQLIGQISIDAVSGKSAQEVLKDAGVGDISEVTVPDAAEAAIGRSSDHTAISLAVKHDDAWTVLTWKTNQENSGPLGLWQSIESVKAEA